MCTYIDEHLMSNEHISNSSYMKGIDTYNAVKLGKPINGDCSNACIRLLLRTLQLKQQLSIKYCIYHFNVLTYYIKTHLS